MEQMIMVAANHDEHLSGLGKFTQDGMSSQPRKHSGKRAAKESEMLARKRSPQGYVNNVDPHRAAELQAIAAVEAQLGEPLRADCPMLGVEFDRPPLNGFEKFMPSSHVHGASQILSHGVERIIHQYDFKPQKNAKAYHSSTEVGYHRVIPPGPFHAEDQASRAPFEYKFIPEQPLARSKADDKLSHSTSLYANPPQSVVPARPPVHGHETLATSAIDLQRSYLPTTDGGSLPPKSIPSLQQDAYPGFSFDNNQFPTNHTSFQLFQGDESILGSENYSLLPEDEQAKAERKRKNEEARIAKEVEIHEKRIRREIERQDIARKKRDEQIRKELERQRREAEKAIRDRQREEERILREHRREMERQERIMEKETKRVERERLKDESRRQKEVEKLKIANERAIAKKLAKESMDLIDDERLELLEAAASSHGLPSIYLLDGETLSGLEKFKGFLKKFPPDSVKMKIPISVYPWANSKVLLGNLFMVWKFLSSFGDILKLWPFTLDEFVQAFHDYDPRLLGEVHIALLRTLVKDIEDVAQASSSGLGSNQYAPGFSGGGHPLLVEAAFAWGFDICEWKKHLSPQTWPEILRQFALAAGYGPRWKKPSVEADLPCEDEGKESDDIVKILKSGMAIEKAVSQMQGRGGLRRRKRHRLTPGTVKFAAFYVLSIEGQRGLSILEVADRIQRSGLRDLSTSKTPEASIAAALSRDAKLFERVAPSTYCVRTAYRKAPEDAEKILQAAREKIRLFENMNNNEEDPEKETEFADEAEREEDSDEDVEDMEGEDLEGTLPEEETALCKEIVESCSPLDENGHNGVGLPLKNSNVVKQSLSDTRVDRIHVMTSESGEHLCASERKAVPNVLLEDSEIDESHVGESWVQGLMEGDYCDLSVEERLNALVVLVEAVNEGNTVRVALEERIEAASALKKQLWAEAQLDRRRFKEEQNMRALQSEEGCRIEATTNLEAEQEGVPHERSKIDTSLNTSVVQAEWGGDSSVVDSTLAMQRVCSNQELMLAQQASHPGDKSRAQVKAEIALKAEEFYAYRCLPLGSDRRYNRYWQFVTSDNRNDNGCGRIFVESVTNVDWLVIDTKESLSALMGSLDTRGVREAQLNEMLRKCESVLKERNERQQVHVESGAYNAMRAVLEEQFSADLALHNADLEQKIEGSIHVECGRSQRERERALDRYLDFDKWLWTKCLRSDSCLNAKKIGTKRCSNVLKICEMCHELYWPRDRHCVYCHVTMENSAKVEVKFSQHSLECEKKYRKKRWRLDMPPGLFPSRIQLLKAEALAVEVAIPFEALRSMWTDVQRKPWAAKLKLASSAGELLELFAELESAIYREWLSPTYETTEELLQISTRGNNGSSAPLSLLPWVPQTTAAAAFRLLKMDAAIFYSQEQRQSSLRINDIKEPSQMVSNGPAILSSAEETSSEESRSDDGEKSDEFLEALVQPSSSRGRGRGGRPRGRGGRVSSSKTAYVSETLKVPKRRSKPSSVDAVGSDQQAEKGGRVLRGRGRGGRSQSRGGRGRGRGRGRSRGRGGSTSTGRKRSRGRGGRASKQSPMVKREPKLIKISLSAPQKKRMSKQVVEDEQLEQRSDGDSDQGGEWEAQDYTSEQYQGQYEEYVHEGNTSDGSIGQELASEPEPEMGSEPEQDEEMFEYEEDDNGDEDVGRPYDGERYTDVGLGEDSGDDEDQFEGEFMGEDDEDDEEEDDAGFTSGESG